MIGWVLRLDSDIIPLWWCGPEHETFGSPLVADALVCDTPDELRAAMQLVGWKPCGPGWIVPLRLAYEQAAPAQCAFAL